MEIEKVKSENKVIIENLEVSIISCKVDELRIAEVSIVEG